MIFLIVLFALFALYLQFVWETAFAPFFKKELTQAELDAAYASNEVKWRQESARFEKELRDARIRRFGYDPREVIAVQSYKAPKYRGAAVRANGGLRGGARTRR